MVCVLACTIAASLQHSLCSIMVRVASPSPSQDLLHRDGALAAWSRVPILRSVPLG